VSSGAADGGRDRRRYRPRLPFALVEQLRELDPGRMLYARANVGPDRNGPLFLMALELLAGLAAMVPPHAHSHHYFGVSALTAASRKSGRRPRRAGFGGAPLTLRPLLGSLIVTTENGHEVTRMVGRFPPRAPSATAGSGRGEA